MKKPTAIAVCLLAGAGLYWFAQAGNLEPPGPPAPTMKTLQEVYDMVARPPDTCFDNTGNRFVDCGNGTVKDTETGLFWLKDADCYLRNWASASITAAQLADGQCGLTDGSRPGDWRLPTLGCSSGSACSHADATGEFASIFAPSCPAPYLPNTAGTGCWSEGDPFSGVQPSNYWSSTTYASNPSKAYVAVMWGDLVDGAPKTDIDWVWPVRGGQ